MNTSYVEEYVYDLLQGLPGFLHYHNSRHTEDVTAAALFLCRHENMSDNDITLIKTAALLHDTGFTLRPNGTGHEEAGCTIARGLLPKAGYNNEAIESVCAMILATRMPQSPHGIRQMILCDADLFYLGTKDYEPVSKRLYREWLAQQKLDSQTNNWTDMQIQFLSSHQYFTKTAQQLLDKQKQSNLQAIIQSQQTKQ